jgi:hypothetical protein
MSKRHDDDGPHVKLIENPEPQRRQPGHPRIFDDEKATAGKLFVDVVDDETLGMLRG